MASVHSRRWIFECARYLVSKDNWCTSSLAGADRRRQYSGNITLDRRGATLL